MKAFFFSASTLFFFFLFTQKLQAQDSVVTISKIEQLAKTPGKLLHTERQPLGNINSTNFYVVTIRDMETGKVQQALQIASQYIRSTDIVSTNSLFIAAEDLQQVLRFMDTILPIITREVLPGEKTYSLVTPDDVALRFHQLDGSSDLYIARLYREQRTVYTPSAIWFNRRRIAEVASLLKSAYTLMQQTLTAESH